MEVLPLVWQLAVGFDLVDADGRPVVRWEGAQGTLCPTGVPWPVPPLADAAPPAEPAAKPAKDEPLPWPRCLTFAAADLKIGGAVWRWVDPTDPRGERPALAELTWTDSASGKLVVYPPPPDPKVKPKKDEPPAPPVLPIEVVVHLPDVSRPPAPASALTTAALPAPAPPEQGWKLEPGRVVATLPMPPGSGVLPPLPAPQPPPKPAPAPKAGEPLPTELTATVVPGTWRISTLECDRNALVWTWHPLLMAVPAPDPRPAKPAPKPKPGDPPVEPPPPPTPDTLVYQVSGSWARATAEKECSDPSGALWYGVSLK